MNPNHTYYKGSSSKLKKPQQNYSLQIPGVNNYNKIKIKKKGRAESFSKKHAQEKYRKS
jgi:hypothetical protein